MFERLSDYTDRSQGGKVGTLEGVQLVGADLDCPVSSHQLVVEVDGDLARTNLGRRPESVTSGTQKLPAMMRAPTRFSLPSLRVSKAGI